MQAFSAAQRALLDARDDQVKMCIEIDDSTPIRKCTGADPIQISGDWYDPHPMKFNRIALTNPKTSKTTVSFDDPPEDSYPFRTQWYSTKLDADATVYWYLREADGSWTNVLTVAWSVEDCSYDRKNQFHVSLSAAAGSRPRAGGAIGTRSEFPYAPEPGEALRLGSTGGVTFRSGVGIPPPPPGGQQMAYDPRNSSQAISDGPGPRDTPDSPDSGNQQAVNPGGTGAANS